MTKIVWTDVAPRDGVQTFPHVIPTATKVRMVRGLLATGVPQVEAGAAVSAKWVPAMADSADVLAQLSAEELERVRVLVPNLRGATTAIGWGARRLLLTIGATETFNTKNVNQSISSSVEGCREIVQFCAAEGALCDVAISVAFGCPYEGVVHPAAVLTLVDALDQLGVADIGIADTIGVATPSHVTDLIHQAGQRIEISRLSIHVHDTRGLGIANVLAAYAAGVTRFDGSLGGIGGCPFAPRSTGNVCSEDALIALDDAGADVGCDLDAYCSLSAEIAAQLGVEFPGRVYKAGRWMGLPIVEEENAR